MSEAATCSRRSCHGELIPSNYLDGKLYCLNPDKAHWIEEDGYESLTCQECGRVWVRDTKRGRKPSACPSC